MKHFDDKEKTWIKNYVLCFYEFLNIWIFDKKISFFNKCYSFIFHLCFFYISIYKVYGRVLFYCKRNIVKRVSSNIFYQSLLNLTYYLRVFSPKFIKFLSFILISWAYKYNNVFLFYSNIKLNAYYYNKIINVSWKLF